MRQFGQRWGTTTTLLAILLGSFLTVRLTAPAPAAPGLTVSPTSITFKGSAGGMFPYPQALTIDVPKGTSWSTFDTMPFADCAPTLGSGSGVVSVSPHTENLE